MTKATSLKFEAGMMVYCETTYRKFRGRVLESCGKPLYLPGERFLVLNFDDGRQYPVSEYCMKRVTDGEPQLEVDNGHDEPMSELGQSLFEMMAGVGRATAMQSQIDAFFKRED